MSQGPDAATSLSALVEPQWRFEFKYRIPVHAYHRIRAMIRPEMCADAHASRGARGRYHVQSLYFDTYDNRLFHEKQAGDTNRIKLRLRTYCEHPSPEERVNFELKLRRGDASGKVVGVGRYGDVRRVLRDGPEGAVTDPAVVEFVRQIHLQQLEPKVITRYEREAYVARSGEELRVTFDHDVRSASAHRLGDVGSFVRMHHRGWLVMEVKTTEEQPGWMSRVIRDLGLRVLANSKFTQALLASRHELHHATGIVAIR